VLAVSGSFLLLATGLWAAGYDPVAVLSALFTGAFGSWYAISSATLLRSIPLIIIALGLAISFRAGSFNIGAEGQFYAGAIAATWLGLHLGMLPSILAIPLVWLIATLAGVVWMVVPVVLKLRFGVLEVITTLLLNFIATSLVSLMVTGPLQESRRTYPQSDLVPAVVRLPVLPGTRLHLGFLAALLLAVFLQVLFARTLWGFHLRVTGSGPTAAEISGRLPVRRITAAALLWSGAFAGLAGGIEISGVSYALFQNLSPGYGFSAIAVALLARLEPLGIIVTGVLFGALEAGAAAMQREAGVPSVVVNVLEALIIISVLITDVLRRRAAMRLLLDGPA
jgi:simple sugar transport system permease protein